ncbi:MAG: hypothetical protein AAGF77_02330 [Bacteroidota bacterium]
MKRFFSILTLFGILATIGCSEIPENNDPVLGAWVKAELEATTAKAQAADREEWIFNDVYLGRYHRYAKSDIAFYTDFRWSVEQGVYTVSYLGENDEEIEVKLILSDDLGTLQLDNGSLFAARK